MGSVFCYLLLTKRYVSIINIEYGCPRDVVFSISLFYSVNIAKWKFQLAFYGNWQRATALSRFNQMDQNQEGTASTVTHRTWLTCTTNQPKASLTQAALDSLVRRQQANLESNSEEYITSESDTSLTTTHTVPSSRTSGVRLDSTPLMLLSEETPLEPPRSSEVWLQSTKREDNFCTEDSADSTELTELLAPPKSEQLTTWITLPDRWEIFMCRELHSIELNF